MRHPIAQWRENKSLTQIQAAEILNTVPAVISQIENGFRGISSERAKDFSEITGIDRIDLLYPNERLNKAA